MAANDARFGRGRAGALDAWTLQFFPKGANESRYDVYDLAFPGTYVFPAY